jgi:hypothetical protein
MLHPRRLYPQMYESKGGNPSSHLINVLDEVDLPMQTQDLLQSPWGPNLTPMPFKSPQRSQYDAYSMSNASGLEAMNNMMNFKKCKSTNLAKFQLGSDGTMNLDTGFREQPQNKSAKKRWTTLTAVLMTITRLKRHRTKTIEDPVLIHCLILLFFRMRS